MLLLVCGLATGAIAQDKIYKLKGPVINAKIIEIGTDEIKYKLFESQDGPVYVVDKSTLNRVEYADGRVEKFQVSYKEPQNYEGQLTKAIKINFLAPLMGYSYVSFEKSVSPLKSYEIGLGIIGAGKNEQVDNYYIGGQYQPFKRDAGGVFFDVGYKFNKLPNFFSKGIRMTHVMQGTYIKPSATIGFYSDKALNYKTGSPDPTIEKRSNVFGAIMINFGRQWVFGDKFLLDIFYGLGYAFANEHNDQDNQIFYDATSNHFAIQKLGEGANLGVNGGLKLGILLK